MSATEQRLNERKGLLGFDSGDNERLARLTELTRSSADKIADDLYRRFLGYEDTRALFEHSSLLLDSRRAHAAYFSRMSAGNNGAGTHAARLRFVEIHERVGLSFERWLDAYHFYLSSYAEELSKGDDPVESFRNYRSLVKVAFLDIGAASEIYAKRRESLLNNTVRLLNQVLERTADHAIVVQDTEGRILSWNEGANRLYGYHADEIIGRNVGLLFPDIDDSSSDPRTDLARAANQNKGAEATLTQLHKDGSRFEATVHLVHRRDEAGGFIGQVLTAYGLDDDTAKDGEHSSLGILLVEDDRAVGTLLSEFLKQKGHAVQNVGTGEEALALFEGNGESFDLVVTDVNMSPMNGLELASRMRTLTPSLRILFVSGVAEQELFGNDGVPENSGFLTKPFSTADLEQAIQKLVSAG